MSGANRMYGRVSASFRTVATTGHLCRIVSEASFSWKACIVTGVRIRQSDCSTGGTEGVFITGSCMVCQRSSPKRARIVALCSSAKSLLIRRRDDACGSEPNTGWMQATSNHPSNVPRSSPLAKGPRWTSEGFARRFNTWCRSIESGVALNPVLESNRSQSIESRSAMVASTSVVSMEVTERLDSLMNLAAGCRSEASSTIKAINRTPWTTNRNTAIARSLTKTFSAPTERKVEAGGMISFMYPLVTFWMALLASTRVFL
mmetsp:Transcript_19119/g.45765  ORF Transcript_19119/g.45765 Transcript_19119/m.45765 type:complete len:260 (-) Transcript_19119:131-910(-)